MSGPADHAQKRDYQHFMEIVAGRISGPGSFTPSKNSGETCIVLFILLFFNGASCNHTEAKKISVKRYCPGDQRMRPDWLTGRYWVHWQQLCRKWRELISSWTTEVTKCRT